MTDQKVLTPEDVLGFKSVTDAQLSPDGELVAFVVGVSSVVDTKYPKSGIWVVPTAGGEPRPLTTGPRSDTMPRWSPDGQTLAFLSDREENGVRRLYLLPRSGGEALRLPPDDGDTPTAQGLDAIAWSPDGGRIAYLRRDADTEEEKKRKEEKDDHVEFEKEPKYTRLHVVIVKTGETRRVSPDGLQVWEHCWSPDGEKLAVVASDLPYEQAWYTCRLAALSLDGGDARTIHSAKRQVARPMWSPDGSQVAFLSSNWSDRGITPGAVFVAPAEGGEAREVSSGHRASAVSLEWSDDSQRLLTAAHELGGIGLAEIDVAAGRRTSLWHGDASFWEGGSIFSTDGHGNVAVVREGPTVPPDVWLARRGAGGVKWERLTRLHAEAADLDIGDTTTVHWKGADSWEMQGLVIRPVGSGGGPYPMVTMVHGGPTGAHKYQYHAAGRGFQLLAARGIAVFLPNPRGSTGWGLEFAESNIGDMGGKDWEDIQAGIDHCVAEGIADPERLGIGGGSYGGFMTAWAVTQTDRFRAGVMLAGVTDWRSFHGRSYLCDWDAIHYGDADPWDPDGTYRRFSPITFVKRARTPTLILHGEQDGDVPVEQSYLFYRALKDLGVETELVVYPREHHGFVERNHKLDQLRRTTEWFVDRLLG